MTELKKAKDSYSENYKILIKNFEDEEIGGKTHHILELEQSILSKLRQNLSHAEMYYICDKLYVYSLIH